MNLPEPGEKLLLKKHPHVMFSCEFVEEYK